MAEYFILPTFKANCLSRVRRSTTSRHKKLFVLIIQSLNRLWNFLCPSSTNLILTPIVETD